MNEWMIQLIKSNDYVSLYGHHGNHDDCDGG